MAKVEPLLSARHIWKKHAHRLPRTQYYGVRDIARELLLKGEAKLRPGEFWALEDVNLEVRRGDSLAVIGPNGAGKTTLLKTLFGLIKPDRGEVRIGGRVEAIIELGTGLSPLLSGRENVRVAAALHGLRGEEQSHYFERVLDFSELGGFIDDPVLSYSAGMRARLAYSMVAQLAPDLLLVDEVLAVGDHAFQRKCVQHMRRFLNEGGALILVSHNTYQIQATCRRGIVLDRGRTVHEGSAIDSVSHYFGLRAPSADAGGRATAPPIGPAVITRIEASPVSGRAIRSRDAVRLTFHYRAETMLDVICGFGIVTEDESIAIAGHNDLAGRSIGPGEGTVSCVIEDLPLVPGRYGLRASIVERETHQPLALLGFEDSAQPFDVEGEPDLLTNAQMQGRYMVRLDVDWSEGSKPS